MDASVAERILRSADAAIRCLRQHQLHHPADCPIPDALDGVVDELRTLIGTPNLGGDGERRVDASLTILLDLRGRWPFTDPSATPLERDLEEAITAVDAVRERFERFTVRH